MKVLFAASECAPLIKVGGLADVVGGLPKALVKLGVEVAIVIPKYESLTNLTSPLTSPLLVGEGKGEVQSITVDYAGKTEEVLVYQTTLPETSIPVYLLENVTYLSTGPAYSAKSAEGSSLDVDRFSFFSKAVAQFISSVIPAKAGIHNIDSRLAGNDNARVFDIVHCHDWHTAWIPLLLKKKTKTLLTIHNMGKQYQGRTDGKIVEKLGLSTSPHPLLVGEGKGEVNILLQGIVNADLINTVSPTYAQEIQTEEYGEDLHDTLQQYNSKLSGILNGIDFEVWNPETDKNLSTNYSLDNWQEGKKRNKAKLLSEIGLPVGENVPTFGMVTRIAQQKGFEILLPALENLFSRQDARVIILGVGDPALELRISNLEFKYKDKLRFITRFDDVLAHLIYAGSDFFFVPSLFEPSGLTQLVAMRYGTLPIVRKTGGLADSVEDGVTGFVFEKYTKEDLSVKIDQAIELYLTPTSSLESPLLVGEGKGEVPFAQMVNSAMQKDFSWDNSAKEYLEIYQKLIMKQ